MRYERFRTSNKATLFPSRWATISQHFKANTFLCLLQNAGRLLPNFKGNISEIVKVAKIKQRNTETMRDEKFQDNRKGRKEAEKGRERESGKKQRHFVVFVAFLMLFQPQKQKDKEKKGGEHLTSKN